MTRPRGRAMPVPGTVAGRLAATALVPEQLLEGETAVLDGELFHHLFRVRRLAVGETLRLVDGRGQARLGEIAGVGKREATLTLGPRLHLVPPALRVDLLVAMPKPERAAWMVEKACELGVARIRLLATERAARVPGAAAVERLRRVAVAALEQSHGGWLAQIDEPEDLVAVLERPTDDRLAVLLDPAGAPVGDWLAGLARAGSSYRGVTVAVGPEGGFTDQEREALVASHFVPLSFGSTILRTETAAVVAIAMLGLGVQPQPTLPDSS